MYNKILIPIDFAHEDQALASINKANKLGAEGGMILLHVVEDIPDYIQNYLPDEFKIDKADNAKNELKALLEKSEVDNARIEVRRGRSYSSILESADENAVNLIIINSHKPGFEDYLLGSTAAKVVRHANCAVLVER